MQARRFEDAHLALDEGLAIAQKNDERFQEAELHRLKGELLLAESPDQTAAAEETFRQAIETARRQLSRGWELRATMSLSRLWQRQGRHDEARAALAAIYNAYTEGFTTPDLVDAAALLRRWPDVGCGAGCRTTAPIHHRSRRLRTLRSRNFTRWLSSGCSYRRTMAAALG